MQIMKKLKNSYIQIAIVMLLLLVVALVPLLIIGKYAHPCADDFTYGYYTHAFWSTTHSLSETLHWAFHQVKATYDTWQGTFSSVFLMALSPAVWGEQYYFLTPVIMLTMIVLPHFYLLYNIIVKLLKAPKSTWLISGSVICFVLIETMFAPIEGLFWYNGAVHYVFMHGCMLLLFGAMLSMAQTRSRVRNLLPLITACLLAIVCGGSNYATALVGILGTLAITVVLFLMQKRIELFLPLAIYGISFYLNVTAYGNQIRQSNFEKGSPIVAVADSFLGLFAYAKTWMTWQILLFMLLMIPIFWKMTKTEKYRFGMPLLITLLSICAVACMLTPGIYAMGTPGAGRTINIIKMWFLLLLFLNESYWIGYVRTKTADKSLSRLIDVRIYVGGILLLIGILFLLQEERKLFDYSSYAAYVSLRAGEAKQFDLEYKERLEILESDTSIVELAEYTTKPRLLYFDDIQEDPYDWRNNAVAMWYGKERVALKK